ncbi:MFS transporter [Tsukamurella sp. 8F]|uniref:MFS transporter n=1 Tax=unclassified Tsukamurella TaxID=2633480 RepID=UPI0023B9B8F9|nr:MULTISPECIES: MFS transporter [unclassified Tsukamurella]MDF0530772.1 MFS transporter [Tsukamurella sp. 8J]MDF0587973.1 MFS transporter [Tsukamurella sp. 8F]
MTFKRWLPLIACSIGTFLLLMHTTAATVSVTVIQRDLHAGFAQGQWVINGFSLAVGALVLAAGAGGDAVGHRRVFVCGMALFGAATAVCAVAPDAGVLIAARIAQGTGGAALLASMIPLLVHSYSGRRRQTALATWSVCSALGGTVGTLGSGVFAHPGMWRLLFAGSVPLAIAAVLVAFFVSAGGEPGSGERSRLDFAGTALTVALMGSATFTLTAAGEFGIASAPTVAATVATVAACAGLVATERRVANPALPPALFRRRGFVGTITTSFAYYFAAFGPLPAIAAWLVHTGEGAATAAVFLATQQVSFILAAAFVRVPERRHTAALALSLGAIALGVSAGALIVDAGLPAPLIVGPLLMSGAGAGLATPILPHRATEAAAPALSGAAAGTMNAARQFGLAAGVAGCGAVAQALTGGTGTSGALVLAAVVGIAGLALLRVLRDVPSKPHPEAYVQATVTRTSERE